MTGWRFLTIVILTMLLENCGPQVDTRTYCFACDCTQHHPGMPVQGCECPCGHP